MLAALIGASFLLAGCGQKQDDGLEELELTDGSGRRKIQIHRRTVGKMRRYTLMSMCAGRYILREYIN